jgi:hypothetical protein
MGWASTNQAVNLDQHLWLEVVLLSGGSARSCLQLGVYGWPVPLLTVGGGGLLGWWPRRTNLGQPGPAAAVILACHGHA